MNKIKFFSAIVLNLGLSTSTIVYSSDYMTEMEFFTVLQSMGTEYVEIGITLAANRGKKTTLRSILKDLEAQSNQKPTWTEKSILDRAGQEGKYKLAQDLLYDEKSRRTKVSIEVALGILGFEKVPSSFEKERIPPDTISDHLLAKLLQESEKMSPSFEDQRTLPDTSGDRALAKQVQGKSPQPYMVEKADRATYDKLVELIQCLQQTNNKKRQDVHVFNNQIRRYMNFVLKYAKILCNGKTMTICEIEENLINPQEEEIKNYREFIAACKNNVQLLEHIDKSKQFIARKKNILKNWEVLKRHIQNNEIDSETKLNMRQLLSYITYFSIENNEFFLKYKDNNFPLFNNYLGQNSTEKGGCRGGHAGRLFLILAIQVRARLY